IFWTHCYGMATVAEEYGKRTATAPVDTDDGDLGIHRAIGIFAQEDLPVRVDLAPVDPNRDVSCAEADPRRLKLPVCHRRAAHQQAIQVGTVSVLHCPLWVAGVQSPTRKRG